MKKTQATIVGIVIIVILVVAGVAAYYMMMPPAPVEKKYFKIGCAISLTGMLAANGKSLQQAYEFWLTNVNKRGGILCADGNRYPVQIIYYDDKSDAATTAKLVEKLITEDKVDLIFGPFSSGCVGPSSAVTEKYKVVMIEAAGNADTLFARGFKYLFTTLKVANELGEAYMRELAKKGAKTVAIIAPEEPFYVSAADGFKNFAPKYGIKVVHYETFPLATTDYAPIVTKLKALNPDIVAMGSHTVPAMTFMKAAKEADFNPKAYCFSFGTMIPSFVKELGKSAEYVMEYTAISEAATFKDDYFGTAKDFYKAYYDLYQMYPDSTISAAVSMGVAIEVAVKNSGVIPPISSEDAKVKFRDALAKVDIMTAGQPVKFHEKGWNIANPLGIVQIQSGKHVCVGPEDWATAKMIYPCPPWKERT